MISAFLCLSFKDKDIAYVKLQILRWLELSPEIDNKKPAVGWFCAFLLG
ncbi:hypothetical protein ACPSKX_03350 [Moritella viscosa]